MVQAKNINYTKSALEKALKARLAALTAGLAGAGVGEKGIDLVKEIKELHSMIASLKPETKPKKTEDNKLVIVWGPPQNSTVQCSNENQSLDQNTENSKHE